jgi:hypothetical protein
MACRCTAHQFRTRSERGWDKSAPSNGGAGTKGRIREECICCTYSNSNADQPPQIAYSPCRKVLARRFQGSSERSSNSFPNMGKLRLSVCGEWMEPRSSRYCVLPECVPSLRTSDHFQGSVFTEFVDYKGVEAFLNADPKPSWDGDELLIMSKEAYVEMKIKEKGLKGKAAIVKRDHITRKGFDAFREMRLATEGKKGKKEAEKAKPEIFVEVFGTKLRVLEEDGGSVDPEEVPHVRGSALRFSGCGGEASFEAIKQPLKERFSRLPFVKFTKGDDAGLVGFDKALDEEDIAFVKEKIPTLNGKSVTWDLPGGTSIPFRSVHVERTLLCIICPSN